MKTTMLPGRDPQSILTCARALRSGELVAFPTETVYGLGANAHDPEAVARIFEAKGRPATNPLITHVHDIEQARQTAGEWSDVAEALAVRFWPGPLTLIVPRGDVPDTVTAGLDSMGLRVPGHPIARALIEAAGCPVAAPSANRYTHVSPTTAQHVVDGLGGRIPWVLDGGPTQVGIESTVLSLVTETPTILRPGMVSAAEISEVLGRVEHGAGAIEETEVRPSPGLSKKHYAPRVPLELVDQLGEPSGYTRRDLLIAETTPAGVPHVVGLSDDPAVWARELYALLHRFGPDQIDRIVVVRPPTTEEWAAIHDRLTRAASD